VLSQVLWTRYFLDAQGYGVTDSTVYQDNQSAMLLEIYGRASSSKRTRHINLPQCRITGTLGISGFLLVLLQQHEDHVVWKTTKQQSLVRKKC
jgi:hypothetical protein